MKPVSVMTAVHSSVGCTQNGVLYVSNVELRLYSVRGSMEKFVATA